MLYALLLAPSATKPGDRTLYSSHSDCGRCAGEGALCCWGGRCTETPLPVPSRVVTTAPFEMKSPKSLDPGGLVVDDSTCGLSLRPSPSPSLPPLPPLPHGWLWHVLDIKGPLPAALSCAQTALAHSQYHFPFEDSTRTHRA